MKTLLYLLFTISISINAQGKYLTKTGTINFEASVPSFEEVAAKNNSVTVIYNSDTNEIAALALVKGFRFKNALMEEHFNENYAESDLYPKATFKGKIIKTETTTTITGTLNFHGVEKVVDKVPINLNSENDSITISGTFTLDPQDFDIKIPKIVRNKVSNDVKVSFLFELNKR